MLPGEVLAYFRERTCGWHAGHYRQCSRGTKNIGPRPFSEIGLTSILCHRTAARRLIMSPLNLVPFPFGSLMNVAQWAGVEPDRETGVYTLSDRGSLATY